MQAFVSAHPLQISGYSISSQFPLGNFLYSLIWAQYRSTAISNLSMTSLTSPFPSLKLFGFGHTRRRVSNCEGSDRYLDYLSCPDSKVVISLFKLYFGRDICDEFLKKQKKTKRGKLEIFFQTILRELFSTSSVGLEINSNFLFAYQGN